jgi:hypothetical protein
MNDQPMTPATLNVCRDAQIDPIIRRRQCKFCRAWFEPKPKANGRAQYCSDEHRYAQRSANRKALTLQRRIRRYQEQTRSLALNEFGQMSGYINKQSSPVVFR